MERKNVTITASPYENEGQEFVDTQAMQLYLLK